MIHNFTSWIELEVGTEASIAGFWARCGCGWEGFARSTVGLQELAAEHREDAERAEELEREEAEHA